MKHFERIYAKVFGVELPNKEECIESLCLVAVIIPFAFAVVILSLII